MEILERYKLLEINLPSTTGVYAIHNKLNGRIYVGSASRQHPSIYNCGFRDRFKSHRYQLRNNKHHSKQLQRAYNKYIKDGLDVNEIFDILVIELVPPEECIDTEQMYLDAFQPFYNTSPIAKNCAGIERSKECRRKISEKKKGHKFSEETKRRMAEERTKKGVMSWAKGKKLSLEHRQKLSAAKLGKPGNNRGWSPSEKTRKKMSEAARKRHPAPTNARSFFGISPQGDRYEFTNATKFCRDNPKLELKPSGIIKCARGQAKQYNGWNFSYADESGIA